MTKRRLFQTTILVSALIFSAGTAIFGAGTAIAGFEWKGPVTPPPVNYENDPANAALNNPENFPSPVGTPAMPAERVQGVEAVPVTPVPLQPAYVAPAPSIINPAPVIDTVPPAQALAPQYTDSADVLTGFGSDLPLAIALQQIVPPGYQYAFGPGVDAGANVSWEGGKPWQQVLGDSLAARGLGFTLKNNTVNVHSGASLTSAPTAMSQPPVMAEQSLPPVTFDNSAPVPLTSAPAASISMPVSEPPRPDVPGIDFNKDVAGSAVAPATKIADLNMPVTIRRQKPLQRPNRTDRTIAQHNIAEGPKDIFPRSPYGFTGRTADNKNVAVARDTVAETKVPEVLMPAEITQTELAQPEITQAELAVTPAPVAPEEDMTPISIAPVFEDTDYNQPAALPPSGSLTSQDVAEPVRQAVTTDDAGEPILAAPSWHGERGQTLRDVLKNWSDVAGVELYWSIDYDYRLTEDIGYPGSYDEAVAKLLDRFSAVRPQPFGQLHQNNDGPRVLVIKSYDLIQ